MIDLIFAVALLIACLSFAWQIAVNGKRLKRLERGVELAGLKAVEIWGGIYACEPCGMGHHDHHEGERCGYMMGSSRYAASDMARSLACMCPIGIGSEPS